LDWNRVRYVTNRQLFCVPLRILPQAVIDVIFTVVRS
jgi:hypothetical protein